MNRNVLARLSAHPFAEGLSTGQLEELAGHGAPVIFRPGERVFAEGGAADRFWLIEDGSIALDLRVPGRGDQIVETLTGGTVLGWSWLQPPYRWQFGAVARVETTAMEFDAVAVRRRCGGEPAFGYAILSSFTPVIIERLQATRLRLLDLYASPGQAQRARDQLVEPAAEGAAAEARP